MAKISFSSGWNRVNPRSTLVAGEDGNVECSLLENFICGNNRIKKIGGTQAYNSTSLGSDNGIPWVERSYHVRGDGSVVSRTFAFYDGAIYHGDDVAGILTKDTEGFRKNAIPLSESFQVAGNSILYFYTGEDVPKKYDGNGSFVWEVTGLSADIEGGISHLQRMWYWHKRSSLLSYSVNLKPEEMDDEILVGDNTRDSFIIACARTGNERFFVFKNDSIWELQGRTSSSFRFVRVTDKYGLTNKRAFYNVLGAIIFQNSDDNELYLFNGTESSIKPITEDTVRLREVQDQTIDSISNSCMTVHKGYFRFAFQHKEDTDIDANGCELVYPLGDPRPDGLPKWSLIRGSRVMSYARFTRYNDNNDLITGRSDVGKLMYHDRGHDFDGLPIYTKIQTADIIASEDKAARFGDFVVKGKPCSHTLPITFKYMVNGRFFDHADTHYFVPKGETRNVGTIILNQSDLYNQVITPLTKFSRGNTISFAFEDNHLGTDIELYSIAFNAKERYKLRSNLQ